jgi:hypothetical protein
MYKFGRFLIAEHALRPENWLILLNLCCSASDVYMGLLLRQNVPLVVHNYSHGCLFLGAALRGLFLLLFFLLLWLKMPVTTPTPLPPQLPQNDKQCTRSYSAPPCSERVRRTARDLHRAGRNRPQWKPAVVCVDGANFHL